jgi:hypothetical protein
MTEEAAIRNSKGEKTTQANTEKENKMKMGDRQINHPIKTKMRLPLTLKKPPIAPQPGRRIPGAQRGHGRNQINALCDLGVKPSTQRPLRRSVRSVLDLSSTEPTEKKLAKKQEITSLQRRGDGPWANRKTRGKKYQGLSISC